MFSLFPSSFFLPYLSQVWWLIIFQVLQNTRELLKQKYKQIPQLSVGGLYDLDQMVSVRLPLPTLTLAY